MAISLLCAAATAPVSFWSLCSPSTGPRASWPRGSRASASRATVGRAAVGGSSTACTSAASTSPRRAPPLAGRATRTKRSQPSGTSLGAGSSSSSPSAASARGPRPTPERQVDTGFKHSALGLQAEYLAGPWSVRTAYARHLDRHLTTNSYHAEAAYRFTDRWQAAQCKRFRPVAHACPPSQRGQRNPDGQVVGQFQPKPPKRLRGQPREGD